MKYEWWHVFWSPLAVRQLLSNDWTDLHATKGMWIDTKWDPLYDIDHEIDTKFVRSNFEIVVI